MTGGNPANTAAVPQSAAASAPLTNPAVVQKSNPAAGAPQQPAAASAPQISTGKVQQAKKDGAQKAVPQKTGGAQGVSPAESDPKASAKASASPVDSKSREVEKKSASIRKGREIIKTRDKETSVSTKLGDLIVPFISVGILLFVIVFIFIPFGTEIVDTREATEDIVHDVRRNEGKVAILRGIEVDRLEDQLRVVSIVVRDAMEVAEFAIEVESLALENNLEPQSQNPTNTQDLVSSNSEVGREWVPLYADAISGPYRFEGAFDDISNFLKDLRLKSRTILSLGAVRVVRVYDTETGEVSENWSIQLDISGYTAAPADTVAISDPVNTELDQETMTEIYQRAGVKVGEGGDVSDEEESDEENQEENGQ